MLPFIEIRLSDMFTFIPVFTDFLFFFFQGERGMKWIGITVNIHLTARTQPGCVIIHEVGTSSLSSCCKHITDIEVCFPGRQ